MTFIFSEHFHEFHPTTFLLLVLWDPKILGGFYVNRPSSRASLPWCGSHTFYYEVPTSNTQWDSGTWERWSPHATSLCQESPTIWWIPANHKITKAPQPNNKNNNKKKEKTRNKMERPISKKMRWMNHLRRWWTTRGTSSSQTPHQVPTPHIKFPNPRLL